MNLQFWLILAKLPARHVVLLVNGIVKHLVRNTLGHLVMDGLLLRVVNIAAFIPPELTFSTSGKSSTG